MSHVHFGAGAGDQHNCGGIGDNNAADCATGAARGNPKGQHLSAFDTFDADSVRSKLLTYLRRQVGAEVEIGALKRYTVGFSWVTFGFTASWNEGGRRVTRDLILRVGPPSGVFAPYRASLQFFALQSLAGSAIPVPRVYWYADDSEALGAPFFVCEFIKGDAPLPWTADGGPAFDEATRLNLGDQFVGALAALHNFAWRDTPVAGVGGTTDPDQTAASQIAFWERLMRQWSTRRYPILEWALIWFRAHAPKAPRISVVHGDYRIGNFLELDGRISAVLDWELVHLGDPIEDLGWICMHAWRGRSPYMCHLLTRDELTQKYQKLTGAPVDASALHYWEVFGTFKLTVMHLGAGHCFETRNFNDLRMAGMGFQLPRMLLQLESAMEQAA
jgi:aminoglycoside phosphotransferase (APT) family kinase protein